MPVFLADRQVVLYAIVAVLWTSLAIAKPSTSNTIFAALWWVLVALSVVISRKVRAQRNARRATSSSSTDPSDTLPSDTPPAPTPPAA